MHKQNFIFSQLNSSRFLSKLFENYCIEAEAEFLSFDAQSKSKRGAKR
jgi:hypothetical protein